jgi:hypothetical protein
VKVGRTAPGQAVTEWKAVGRTWLLDMWSGKPTLDVRIRTGLCERWRDGLCEEREYSTRPRVRAKEASRSGRRFHPPASGRLHHSFPLISSNSHSFPVLSVRSSIILNHEVLPIRPSAWPNMVHRAPAERKHVTRCLAESFPRTLFSSRFEKNAWKMQLDAGAR